MSGKPRTPAQELRTAEQTEQGARILYVDTQASLAAWRRDTVALLVWRLRARGVRRGVVQRGVGLMRRDELTEGRRVSFTVHDGTRQRTYAATVVTVLDVRGEFGFSRPVAMLDVEVERDGRPAVRRIELAPAYLYPIERT